MNPFSALHGLGRLVLFVIAAVIVAAIFAGRASAATTFTASATSANGQLATSLTWSSTLSECVASGHPSWEGDKPSSGSLDLPPITLSGTYTLTLACSQPGDDTASLFWKAPTQNTDGSALTNLAGYRVVYGRSPTTMTQTVELANPSLLAYVVEELSPGTWHFAVKAYNAAGVESAQSNVASKTMTLGTDETESVTLTVNPIPNAPADLGAL